MLWLDDVSEDTWLAFREQGHIDSLARASVRFDHALAPIRDREPALLRSWLRSKQHGAAFDVRGEDALMRGEALRLRVERVQVIEALGQRVFEGAARAASERDHVLLLADASGTIVRSLGGGAFAEEAQRARLIEGAAWSEEARGTNAIGTAAAEGSATAVIGRAHFGRPQHGLACYAAPIRDLEGRLVGVLDATSRAACADRTLAARIASFAQTLEELLRLEAYASAGAAVARALGRSLDDLATPALLVEAPGRLARMNRALCELFGARRPFDLRAALGLDWGALSREALFPSAGGTCVRLSTPSGLRVYRLFAEPIVSASGGLLSVLVRLVSEQVAAPARRASAAGPARKALTAGEPQHAFARIFARDQALTATLAWARKVAASDLPVMLLAETGAGKELVAAAVHASSARAQGPFVAVNCGAIAPSLLESELFGYAPGAFTGADRRGRTGLLQAASGGTLFLDEVSEMPLAMQAALLRVLETFRYRRVGEHTLSTTDARIVCATCLDLDALVASGVFRRDLYYRLKGAIIRLPALRERSDLLPLAEHLLAERAAQLGVPLPTLSEEARVRLIAHAWPGNVRELKSALEVALVASQGEHELRPEHLPAELSGPAPSVGQGMLEDHRATTVRRVLEEARGNMSVAARRLGIARSTLYRMLRRYRS